MFVLLCVAGVQVVDRNLANVSILQRIELRRGAGVCPLPVFPLSPSARRGVPMRGFWAGCAAYARGDLERAVEVWREGDALEYFTVGGMAAARAGDYKRALDFFTVAARIKPDAATWLRVAGAQQNLATVGAVPWASVVETANRVLSLSPEDPEAHYLHGYGLWLGGFDAAMAERELRWAVARRGDWGECYSLGRLLLDRGDALDAIPLLQTALRIRGTGAGEVRPQLLRAHLMARQCDTARTFYRASIETEPDARPRLDEVCRAAGTCSCG